MIAGDATWLESISHNLIGNLGSNRRQLLLYLEMGDGWSSGCVYVDEGNRILSFALQRDLWAQFYNDWEALEDDKRWAVLKLLLHADGKFTASIDYADEASPISIDSVSERDVLAARAAFGDKPIHYPPPPAGAFDLTDAPRGLEGPLG